MIPVTISLPDGRWLVLEREQFDAALARGVEMGLTAPAVAGTAGAVPTEKLLNSRELAAIVSVGDVTLESMAKRGEIPFVRVGRALRFNASEVLAALQRNKEKK